MKYDYDLAKKKYREFCSEYKELSIFMQPWYLDAAIEKNESWRVILIYEANKIVAAFPFGYKTHKGMKYIFNPFQVSRLEIWIDYGNRETEYKRASYYNEIVKKIIELLPPYDSFKIGFSYKMNNWMPFYQCGFTQTTMYSYVLYPDGLKNCWDNLQKYRRKEIKKAINEFTVTDIHSINEFWECFEDCYAKKEKDISFKKSRLEKLYYALKEHNNFLLRGAYTITGKLVAGLFIIYDRNRSYTLFVAFDSNYSGARAMLDWDGICVFLSKDMVYDFEGSMIPGVAEYNRRFNAKLEPYFIISKESKRYRILSCFKHLGQEIFGCKER